MRKEKQYLLFGEAIFGLRFAEDKFFLAAGGVCGGVENPDPEFLLDVTGVCGGVWVGLRVAPDNKLMWSY